MSVRRSFAAAAVLLALAGCGTQNSVAPLPSVPLSSLAVSPLVDTLHVGDAHMFVAVAVDTAGDTLSSPALTWTSGNGTILSVNSAGLATGVGEGTTTLSVSSGGKTATASLLVLPTQRGWFKQTSNLAGDNLNGLFFLPNGNSGWAVGTTGHVVHTTNAGATWSTQTSGVGNSLNAVWFTSATEGWIVGDAGRILHTTNAGATWGLVPSGTLSALNALAFATPDTGWIVGQSGTVLSTVDHGATWTRSTPTVTASALRGVSFAGTRNGWAVGDNGVIIGTHDRGASWFVVQPAVTTNALYSVKRLSEPVAFAVGTLGVTPRTVTTPDSTAWELRNAGTYDLHCVTFVDALHGWAVGRNPTGLALVTIDGGLNWTPQAVNNTYQLNGVYFVDGMRGWAVGDNGSVLHTVTGGAP